MTAQLATEAVNGLLQALSKANTNDIPSLLLTIEDLLGQYDNKVIKLLLWDNEILSTLTDILQIQDFSCLDWSTSARLCALLAKCCVGFTQPPDFRSMFLPLVVDRIMTVGANIQASEIPNSSDFKVCMECVFWLIEYCSNLAAALLESDRLLQMLMSEGDAVIEQCILRLLKVALLALPSVQDLEQDKLLNLFDELMFKLYSGSSHMTVQQMCADVIRSAAHKHPPIKRMMLEFDSETSLSELAAGTDNLGNISNLINFVKKCRAEEAEAGKLNQSATKIQCCYRGYATRKKLQETSHKVSKFQRKFREYLKGKREKEACEKEKTFEKELSCSKARERRKINLIEEAVQIKSTPASQLHKHQHQVKSTAASRIQAAWRMTVARRKVAEMRQHREVNRAAVLIQRAFRKHRGDVRGWGRLPPGLTAEKVAQLQLRIQNLKQDTSDTGTYAERDMLTAQDLYLRYTRTLNKTRQVQQRRHYLASQVSDQISALVKAPALSACTWEDARLFTCYDPVLLEEAKRAHRQCLSSKSEYRMLNYRADKSKPGIELMSLDNIKYSPLTYKIQQLP